MTSIVRPIEQWLLERGVDVRFGVRVTDVDFDQVDPSQRLLTRLHVRDKSGDSTIELAPDDVTMLTLGSITADATYAGNDTVPELIRDRRDGAWALWETVAKKANDFGRPNTFDGNIDENKWESFTLTMHGDLLLKRLVAYSGNEPGTGGLMTFVDSGWLMSIVVPHQPHFPDMPADTYTLWGYGLFIDDDGDYVKKPMAKSTGREILTELIGQLGFDDIRDAGACHDRCDQRDDALCFGLVQPAHSRRTGRWCIPKGSANFAFLGQFVELPEDTVFTVEYSVHCAMHAVYHLYSVDKQIPPIYHGLTDPKVGLKALKAAFH